MILKKCIVQREIHLFKNQLKRVAVCKSYGDNFLEIGVGEIA